MDFGRAFTFIFDDPEWIRKLVTISLVSLIPFIGPVVLLGWSLNITRRVIDRYTNPLPEMEFSEDLRRGLRGFAGVFIYIIPIFVVAIVYVFAVGASIVNLDTDLVDYGITVASLCFTSITIIYSFALIILVPAAMGNLEAKDELSAAFQFSDVLDLIRSAPMAYILVIAGILILSLVVPVGLVACVIGIIFTLAYQAAVMGYLYGAAYNEARSNTLADSL